MTNGANLTPEKNPAPATLSKAAPQIRPSRLAIGVHSMPKTSAGNLKLWFILGGVILMLFAVIIFLVLN
ncbi:MAG: hypothetical protein WCW61_00535 [Patescibacteria group bacterium]|jgi:hypothetical protein